MKTVFGIYKIGMVLTTAGLFIGCSKPQFAYVGEPTQKVTRLPVCDGGPIEECIPPSPTPTPTPVPATPTPTPTPVPATPTPTPTPVPATPTPTPTPVPATPTPTPTPVPATPTPTPTPVPATPTPTPTPVQKATQTFYQDDGANKVDVLFVVDNSSSMETEQSKMASKFTSFISSLQTVDYHIGVITTENDYRTWGGPAELITFKGSNSKYLTNSTPNANQLFLNTIRREETVGCYYRTNGEACGSTNEQPLLMSITAMQKRNMASNSGFFRDNVDLVIVVLSDEDEMSEGPANATKPQAVINEFRSIWGNTKKLSVYSIIIKPGDRACLRTQDRQQLLGAGAHYGNILNQFAKATGGESYSICESDYSNNLKAISDRVAQLINTFELPVEPESGSVEVELSHGANISYTVDGKKIIFAHAPAAGTQITVRYLEKK